jgi:hypothetical protein
MFNGMFLRSSSPSDAPVLARSVISVLGQEGWSDPFQPRLLVALLTHVFGIESELESLEPITRSEVRDLLPDRRRREELIDLMVAMEVVCNPIPIHLSDAVDEWANDLGIDEVGVQVARELARGEVARATADFLRSTYTSTANAHNEDFARLFDRYGERAINFTVEEDTRLADRFRSLEHCAAGSLGRELWQFYTDRQFLFPGEVGGANLALAHHDWGHVIYGYGTTGIGEVEAAAFRAASSDFRGVGLQFFGDLMFYQSALLTSLVTGSHPRGEMDVPNAECRVAEAIRRGRVCTLDPYAPGFDFFDHVDKDLEGLRLLWNVVPAVIGSDCSCVSCRTGTQLDRTEPVAGE